MLEERNLKCNLRFLSLPFITEMMLWRIFIPDQFGSLFSQNFNVPADENRKWRSDKHSLNVSKQFCIKITKLDCAVMISNLISGKISEHTVKEKLCWSHLMFLNIWYEEEKVKNEWHWRTSLISIGFMPQTDAHLPPRIGSVPWLAKSRPYRLSPNKIFSLHWVLGASCRTQSLTQDRGELGPGLFENRRYIFVQKGI